MKPQPFTPPDCDLRCFAWMPLDVVRLRDSDLAVLANGDAFRAAVFLWCAAWHQVPAASLPNDDRLLANLAGFGRDLKSWEAVKADALRGFVECSDGRLYHPVVAEKALESYEQLQRQKARTKAATNARRNGKRDDEPPDERYGDRHDQGDDHQPEQRDDNRDVQRNEVQQTLPNQTVPEREKKNPKTMTVKTERESPTEAKQEPPPAAPGSLSEVSTPLSKEVGSKPSRLGSVLGTELPEKWTPDDELCEEVKRKFGMTDEDVAIELYAFHAKQAAEPIFSNNWRATFVTWCKRWREHKDRQPKPRVEVSNAKPFVPTDADWERAIDAFKTDESRWPRWAGNNPSSGKVPRHLLEKHGWNADLRRFITPEKAA
jgi:hypothetical protein